MRLLREWVRIILEGYVADQQELINNYPEQQDEIRRMNPKMISWFIKRFGSNPSIQEVHPFGDCVSTVKKYESKSAGLNQKYRSNPEFKQLVDDKFPQKKWSTPADYLFMSVDDMELILRLSERKKARFGIENAVPDRSDFVGKFGSWNLWMPTTRENSVKIAGYDPETLEPSTTWCTARIGGSNLFYNYAGRGIILYYIINDSPKSSADWLSIGFIDSEPVLDGESGGVSVDRDNKGLTAKRLKSIVGAQYEPIMTAMKQKTTNTGGEHPAKKKIEKAAENLEEYQNMIVGLSPSESNDLSYSISTQKTISAEVAEKLSNHPDPNIRSGVAHNPNTPENILEVLSNDSNPDVRFNVAINPSTPEQVLKTLSTDKESYVREALAENPKTPGYILVGFLNDLSTDIGYQAAQNPNMPVKKLIAIYKGDNMELKLGAAKNPNTPAYILNSFASNKNVNLRISVATNPSLPVEILEMLAGDQDLNVRIKVADNTKTPIYVLKNLANNDEVFSVKKVAKATIKKMQISEIKKLIKSKFFL